MMRAVAPATFPHTLDGLLLGLIVLLVTPVIRVSVSVFAFALQDDQTHEIITGLVRAFSIFGMGPWLARARWRSRRRGRHSSCWC